MACKILALTQSILLCFVVHTLSKTSDDRYPNTSTSQFSKSFSEITKYFKLCDTYFTTDHDHTSVDLFNKVLSPSSFSFPSSRIVLHLLTYFPHDSNDSSSNCATKSCIVVSTRKYSQCSLVIGFFTEGMRHLPTFTNMLISPFLTPIKNEQDYFIFILG